MPCYDTGSAEGDARQAAAEAGRRVTELASALCELCAHCEAKGVPLTPQAALFWSYHKRLDEERKRDEERWAKERAIRDEADALIRKRRQESGLD